MARRERRVPGGSAVPLSCIGWPSTTDSALACRTDTARGSAKADCSLDVYAICIQAGATLAVLALYKQRIRQMIDGLLGRREHGRTMLRVTGPDWEGGQAFYAALRRSGRDIPEDLSVVAIGNSLTARFLDPPLTTVVTPIRGAGIAAAQLIADRIAGKPVNDPGPLAPRLVQRGSTARPRES